VAVRHGDELDEERRALEEFEQWSGESTRAWRFTRRLQRTGRAMRLSFLGLFILGPAVSGFLTTVGYSLLGRRPAQLRMTDDFAAMSSAAIALILTLGFLEMNSSLKEAQGRADAVLAARTAGVEPQKRAESDLYGNLLVVLAWIAASLLMAVALTLIFLWAAIDGHGPARWLAYYVLYTVSVGLSGVLAAAIAKAVRASSAVTETYVKSWAIEYERSVNTRRERMGTMNRRVNRLDDTTLPRQEEGNG
jgi:hypothetical protein